MNKDYQHGNSDSLYQTILFCISPDLGVYHCFTRPRVTILAQDGQTYEPISNTVGFCSVKSLM